MSDLTTVGLLIAATEKTIEGLADAQRAGDQMAAREFAMAKTAIEDAIMRTNAGRARLAGIFQISDVEAGITSVGTVERGAPGA